MGPFNLDSCEPKSASDSYFLIRYFFYYQGIEQKIKTQILLNSANPLGNMITDSKENEEWKIYQCKTCEMWMLATDKK